MLPTLLNTVSVFHGTPATNILELNITQNAGLAVALVVTVQLSFKVCPVMLSNFIDKPLLRVW